MTRHLICVVGGAIALLVAACGGDDAGSSSAAGSGGPGAGSPKDDLPCALSEMLVERCQQCHASEPLFGAPLPLVSRGDLLAKALDGTTMVAQLAITRMQDESRMPPPPNAAATSAEIALLQQWIADGTPARPAGETCGGQGGAGGEGAGCAPDVTLTATSPYEMPSTSDDEQICFGIELNALSAKRHITAIAPKIDNATIIHHMLLLQATSAVSPDPAPCAFTNPQWKLLYAWGPGTPPLTLPPAAGFPLEPGEDTHFVMQIHYNNLQGLVGETDQSGIDLCTTTDLRDNDADIMAFGGSGFDGIIPMATSQLDCSTPIPTTVSAFFPVTVFQSWPHMHQLGAAMKTVVEHADGSNTTLVDVPDYDFNYQVTYPNDQLLAVGDTVRTTCTWLNDTANSVGFGENTTDEMCFNFLAYYPRVEFGLWNWLLPAQGASCNLSQP